MPARDTIFQRLNAATEAELRALALALDEELIGEPSADIALLSRELRADAGNAIRNIRRKEHELEYRTVLDEVVEKAAGAAGWDRPRVAQDAKEAWLEDYVLHAFLFASRKEKANDQEKRETREAAERLIRGEPVSTKLITAGRAGLYAATLVAGGLIGGGLVRAIEWISSPAMRRVIPAVLVMIFIRQRLELEREFGEEP